MPRTDIKYGDFSFAEHHLPIPTVSIGTTLNKTPAGALIGGTTNVTLNGKLVATGVLNYDDNWPSFQQSQTQGSPGWLSLIEGVTGIQYYFSKDFQRFDIKCDDSEIFNLSDVEQRNTKVTRVEFANQSDENWAQTIDYTIELQIERTGILDYFSVPQSQTNAHAHYVSSIENSYSISPITDHEFYLSIPTSINAQLPNQAFVGNMYPYATGDMYPGYNISRTLSATGKSTASGTALDNAKHFVTGMLYYDVGFLDIIKNLTVFDRVTSIEANPVDGTYSIKDSFVAYSGVVTRPYTETFDINSSIDDKLNKTISINGKIKGLRTLKDNSSQQLYAKFLTKDQKDFFPTEDSYADSYTNASGYFTEMLNKNIPYNRVLSIATPTGAISGYTNSSKNSTGFGQLLFTSQTGLWINPVPLTSKADHNFVNGEISYSFSYDSRPLSLVTGAIREDISVSDDYALRSTVTQILLNRPPLIQDLGTYSLPKRKVAYKGTFPAPIYGYFPDAARQQVINLIDNFNPNRMNPERLLLNNSNYYIYSWITENTENFDPINGSFVKNISWSYELRRPL